MELPLAQKAINLALAGNWQEAIAVNLKILEELPNDIDALNRLCRAYCETGQIDKAKYYALKALEVNPTNSIAQKALEKLKNQEKMKVTNINASHPGANPVSFLEVPGMTKIAELVRLGDKSVLVNLSPGDEVFFQSHPHSVSIVTLDQKYIGRLKDDLAARISKSIKNGSQFKIYIKSITSNSLKIFIRCNEKLFPPEKIDYISFTPPELVHKDSSQIQESEDIN